MNIETIETTKTQFFSNLTPASSISNTDVSLMRPIGNIIDHRWYDLIETKPGRPYFGAISIFSEIVYWLRRNSISSSSGWQTSYAHFIKKFGFSHETIRKALVKLEHLKVIRREFRDIKIKGQLFNNILFIYFDKNIDQFLSFGNSKKIFSSLRKYPSPQEGGEYIYKENKEEKNRSSRANLNEKKEGKNLTLKPKNKTDKFLEISSTKEEIKNELLEKEKFRKGRVEQSSMTTVKEEEKKMRLEKVVDIKEKRKKIDKEGRIRKKSNLEQTRVDSDEVGLATEVKGLKEKREIEGKKEGKTILSQIVKRFSVRRKNLKEYLPISQEVADELNKLSRREFSSNFMNLLAEKLAERNDRLGFYSKSLFIQYMVKVLANELRQSVQVNNENFKFKAAEEEERQEEKMERYLSEVEQSTARTKEAIFKRKIAAIFEKEAAYKLLITMSIKEREEELIINCSSQVESSQRQKIELLNEAKLIYGKQIQRIQWSREEEEKWNTLKEYQQRKSQKIAGGEMRDVSLDITDDKSMWGRLKAELIKSYGIATYVSWFSKLAAQENEDKNSLTLTAPNGFIRNWIKNNYERGIQKASESLLIEVFCL